MTVISPAKNYQNSIKRALLRRKKLHWPHLIWPTQYRWLIDWCLTQHVCHQIFSNRCSSYSLSLIRTKLAHTKNCRTDCLKFWFLKFLRIFYISSLVSEITAVELSRPTGLSSCFLRQKVNQPKFYRTWWSCLSAVSRERYWKRKFDAKTLVLLVEFLRADIFRVVIRK